MRVHEGSLRGLAPALALFTLGALIVAGLPWRVPGAPRHRLSVSDVRAHSCDAARAPRRLRRGHTNAPAVVRRGARLHRARRRGDGRLLARGRWGTVVARRWVQWGLVALGGALVLVWAATRLAFFEKRQSLSGKSDEPAVTHAGKGFLGTGATERTA